MRTLSVAVAIAVTTLALPSFASAAQTAPREFGECSFPILTDAKMESEVSNTFENGNLILNGNEGQHTIIWLAGANAEVTDEVVELYAGALTSSGAWIGLDAQEWTEVDGHKAAKLPVKIAGEEQPNTGTMLLWADPESGRFFMFILTPAQKGGKSVWSEAALDAEIESAAATISCEGAGSVEELFAVLEPSPAGWWRDDSDLPRLMYGRRDRKQTIFLWSSKLTSSKYACAEPAATLFERFLQDPDLSQAGDSRAEVDNSDGAADGPVLCSVVADVAGWSNDGGDTIRYTLWTCPDREDQMAASLEILAGDLGEERLDPQANSICTDALPEPPPVLIESTSDEPKEQWTPKPVEKKKKGRR